MHVGCPAIGTTSLQGDRMSVVCPFSPFYKSSQVKSTRPGPQGAARESGTHERGRSPRRCVKASLHSDVGAESAATSPDPKWCSVKVKSSYFHTSVTFERPCVPPKTQRQSIGQLLPVPNPISFRRYAWPFKMLGPILCTHETAERVLHLLGSGLINNT